LPEPVQAPTTCRNVAWPPHCEVSESVTMLFEPSADVPVRTFSISTIKQDEDRAELSASGRLDADTACVLAAAATAHFDAGRRFLRVGLRGVVTLADEAVATLTRLHAYAVACRGSVIFTGVDECAAERLRHAPALLWQPG
jgi:hypothetical protein